MDPDQHASPDSTDVATSTDATSAEPSMESDQDGPRKQIGPAEITLALLFVSIAIWFVASGAYRELDAQRVHREILALRGFGPVVFVLAFSLLQPLGPSGHIFTIAASLVWTPPVAFALSLAGAVGSQIVAFVFYRYVASDFARRRIPKKLLAYEQRLVDHPFISIVALRVVSFTWTFVAMLLGISRVRFAPMVGATVIGLAPGVAIDVWLGGAVLRWIAG